MHAIMMIQASQGAHFFSHPVPIAANALGVQDTSNSSELIRVSPKFSALLATFGKDILPDGTLAGFVVYVVLLPAPASLSCQALSELHTVGCTVPGSSCCCCCSAPGRLYKWHLGISAGHRCPFIGSLHVGMQGTTS